MPFPPPSKIPSPTNPIPSLPSSTPPPTKQTTPPLAQMPQNPRIQTTSSSPSVHLFPKPPSSMTVGKRGLPCPPSCTECSSSPKMYSATTIPLQEDQWNSPATGGIYSRYQEM